MSITASTLLPEASSAPLWVARRHCSPCGCWPAKHTEFAVTYPRANSSSGFQSCELHLCMQDSQNLDLRVGAARSSPGDALHFCCFIFLFSFRTDFYLHVWLFAGGKHARSQQFLGAFHLWCMQLCQYPTRTVWSIRRKRTSPCSLFP